MTSDAIEHALQTGVVIHLIGGSDADTEADTIVEEVRTATDSELRRVACSPETTTEAIPTARVPEGTLVYYLSFARCIFHNYLIKKGRKSVVPGVQDSSSVSHPHLEARSSGNTVNPHQ